MSRALLSVVGAALLLGACGGGKETATTMDFAPPTETSTTATSTGEDHGAGGPAGQANSAHSSPTSSVKAALTSTDAAVACDQAVTAAYLQVAYGSEGGCTAAVRSGSQARSARLVSVDTAGDRATVKVVPSGGPSDGDTLTVSLVLENETWKVDAIRSNAPVGP
jgi:hypothetical protein